jgi:hypothetical protein
MSLLPSRLLKKGHCQGAMRINFLGHMIDTNQRNRVALTDDGMGAKKSAEH